MAGMGLTLYQSITPTSTQGVEEEQEVTYDSSASSRHCKFESNKDVSGREYAPSCDNFRIGFVCLFVAFFSGLGA